MGLLTVIELESWVLAKWALCKRFDGGRIYDLSGCEALGAELREPEEAACETSVIVESSGMTNVSNISKMIQAGVD